MNPTPVNSVEHPANVVAIDRIRVALQARDAANEQITDSVRELLQWGVPEAVIARETGLSRTTVRRHNGKG